MNRNKQCVVRDAEELDVEDWMRRAEQAHIVALKESRVAYTPPAETICRHCQLSVEQILKAYVIAKENHFDYTHELKSLLKKSQQYLPGFDKFHETSALLTEYEKAQYPSHFKISKQDVEDALKMASEIFVFTRSQLSEMGFTALNAVAKFDEISTKEQIGKYMNSVHSIKIHPNVDGLITKIVDSNKMTAAEVCQLLEEQLFVAGGVLRWNIEEHEIDKHKSVVEKATLLGDDFVITRDTEVKDSRKENYFLHCAYKYGNPTREEGLFGEVRSIAEEYAINDVFKHILIELSN